MKKLVSLCVGLLISAQPAFAFLNIGGNYSKNYYFIQNGYDNSYIGIHKMSVAMSEMAKSVSQLSASVRETLWTPTERERIRKLYDMDRIGSVIGINLDYSSAGEIVSKVGVTGLQKLIEDRIFYLETDLKLAKALEFSLLNGAGSDMSAGDLDLKIPLKKLNAHYVAMMIDFVRRNPDMSGDVAPVFLDQIKNMNAKDRQILQGKTLSKEENDKMTSYLMLIIKKSLESGNPPVDFAGISFENISSSNEAINSISNTFNRNFSRATKEIDEYESKCIQLAEYEQNVTKAVEGMEKDCKKVFSYDSNGISLYENYQQRTPVLQGEIYYLEAQRKGLLYSLNAAIGRQTDDMRALEIKISNKTKEIKELSASVKDALNILAGSGEIDTLVGCQRAARKKIMSKDRKEFYFYNENQYYCKYHNPKFEGNKLLVAHLNSTGVHGSASGNEKRSDK